MIDFFKQLFTDANERPEPKNIIGFITIIIAFIYLFIKWDVTGFGVIFGLGLGCFTVSTVADNSMDKMKCQK